MYITIQVEIVYYHAVLDMQDNRLDNELLRSNKDRNQPLVFLLLSVVESTITIVFQLDTGVMSWTIFLAVISLKSVCSSLSSAVLIK